MARPGERATIEVMPGVLVDMTILEAEGSLIKRAIVHSVVGQGMWDGEPVASIEFPAGYIREDRGETA